MKKTYHISSANNGYIIRFGHLDNSYAEENLRIAMTSEEILKIIKEDLSLDSEGLKTKK